jgi:NAD(P)-dependent dehydrogenase (short-subunit alcohol dehydrogenase family)
MLLQGKTLLVTGAGSGIGRAVSLVAAREGAAVVVSDLNVEGGEETVRLIEQASPEAGPVFVRADASDPGANEALVRTAVERFGALHLACNNAGIGGEMKPTGELGVEGWRKVIEVDLSGVFYGMRAQIPQMLAAGGGAIINMASILGQVGMAGAADYVAAKHGVVGLTRTAAIEYAAQGVRINAVGPGFIDTPILDAVPEEGIRALVSTVPMGRLGRPEEVGELVVWLLSERASFLTGGYYPIDGGFLAQ